MDILKLIIFAILAITFIVVIFNSINVLRLLFKKKKKRFLKANISLKKKEIQKNIYIYFFVFFNSISNYLSHNKIVCMKTILSRDLL